MLPLAKIQFPALLNEEGPEASKLLATGQS
jgi:hypothetical protein